jgi:methylated-DNA-[protein]-cysteine S-methyltransferase
MPPTPTPLYLDKIPSPMGEILLISDGEKLCGLDFADYETRLMQRLTHRYGAVTMIAIANPQGFSDRLQAYLQGDHHSLDDIPVSTDGTAFQQQVWLALRTIPVGTTLTYGQLATQLGKPTASRAVGMANALNPVAIVLPCHRVIGANGALTGYAGGLHRKQWLLQHEGFTLF